MRYLTHHLPPLTARYKVCPQDFRVTEIPLYLPSGQGTHTYLRIEKRGLSTPAVARRLARILGRREGEIGYAGMKDERALTEQWFSVEHLEPEVLPRLEGDGIRILETTLHRNKLKMGHLAGNRFRILLRSFDHTLLPQVDACLERLQSTGLPNYFGPQRFGQGGMNPRLGRLLQAKDHQGFLDLFLGEPRPAERADFAAARQAYREGDPAAAGELFPPSPERRLCQSLGQDPRRAVHSLPKRLLTLFLGALQAEAFNRVLDARLENGLFERLLAGDVAWIHRNGACFLVQDPRQEEPRRRAGEISPSGPLAGPRCLAPEGEPGRLEQEILAAAGLTPEATRGSGGLSLRGARRPLRVPVTEVERHLPGDDQLELSFRLPPGSYATVLLAEICKGGLACSDT